MQNDKSQVLVLGMKKYDSFKDREGKEISAGCSVTLGVPYNANSDNKRGYEFKTYTFRENVDVIFNRFKECRFPFVGVMISHRENAFSNNVIIDDLQLYENE